MMVVNLTVFGVKSVHVDVTINVHINCSF